MYWRERKLKNSSHGHRPTFEFPWHCGYVYCCISHILPWTADITQGGGRGRRKDCTVENVVKMASLPKTNKPVSPKPFELSVCIVEQLWHVPHCCVATSYSVLPLYYIYNSHTPLAAFAQGRSSVTFRWFPSIFSPTATQKGENTET